MNSIQLAQRLARNLSVEDPLNLSADAALDVLAAMNGGLAAFYREMPGIYKRTTLSATVRTPGTLSVTFTGQYANTVGDNTFTSVMQGCTLRFGGGAADTEINGANTVLDNYLGTDLGPLEATVYYDAVPIQDVIERIIGNVRLYDNTQSAPTILTREERLRGGRSRFWNSGSWGQGEWPADLAAFGQIGRPRFYYLDPVGASQGGEPEFLLRLAPLPDTDYTIRMEAELSTQRLVFSDLSTARTIYVADQYLDDILVPLCEAELVTSPLWRSEPDGQLIKTVLQRAANALANKIPKIPSDIGPAGNLIGTPPGY